MKVILFKGSPWQGPGMETLSLTNQSIILDLGFLVEEGSCDINLLSNIVRLPVYFLLGKTYGWEQNISIIKTKVLFHGFFLIWPNSNMQPPFHATVFHCIPGLFFLYFLNSENKKGKETVIYSSVS